MKATLKVNPSLVVELEGGNQKELFEKIASTQEIFKARSCELCKSDNTTFNVRTATKDKKTFTYYELKCNHCGASFQFGVLQEGDRLFPKGWTKYNPQE